MYHQYNTSGSNGTRADAFTKTLKGTGKSKKGENPR